MIFFTVSILKNVSKKKKNYSILHINQSDSSYMYKSRNFSIVFYVAKYQSKKKYFRVHLLLIFYLFIDRTLQSVL